MSQKSHLLKPKDILVSDPLWTIFELALQTRLSPMTMRLYNSSSSSATAGRSCNGDDGTDSLSGQTAAALSSRRHGNFGPSLTLFGATLLVAQATLSSAFVFSTTPMRPLPSLPSFASRLPSHSTPALLARRPLSQSSVSGTTLWGTKSSRGKNDDNDSDSYFEAQHLHAFLQQPSVQARTDLGNFLTQRALQSFLFLLTQCRDEVTVHWLEKTLGLANVQNFHGTAAFNLTLHPAWDSVLLDLVVQPSQIITIRSKRRGRGHGGWSKDNPYLEERFVEFDVDIEPAALVQRLLSVRDQIAQEWYQCDLQTLQTANDMILDSYHAFQAQLRLDEKDKQPKVSSSSTTSRDSAAAGPSNSLDDDEDEDDDEYDDDDDEATFSSSFDSSDSAMHSDESIQVAKLTAPYEKSFKAYDRTAMMILGNNIVHDGRSSSPYRSGTFDLLGLLATQESIHRVLQQYSSSQSQRGKESVVSFEAEWLYQFYVARLASHFDGNQEYGRADDFLEELLLSPPSVKTVTTRTRSGQSMTGMVLIDPLRMAEDIIAMRSQVALDWRTQVDPAKMAADHVELRNLCLACRMMGQTIQKEQEQKSSTTAATTAATTSRTMILTLPNEELEAESTQYPLEFQ